MNDQAHHERYRNAIFLSFVEGTRKTFLFEDKRTSDDAIENDAIWVSWMVGAGPGLKAVTKELQLAKEDLLKVVACKHASATTDVQQACDASPAFKVFKSFAKKTTENVSPAFGLKGRIVLMMDNLFKSGEVILTLPIRKALIDHLVTAPDIFTRGMNKRNVLKGFIKNGMIDLKLNHFPDFEILQRTCKIKDFQKE